MIHVDAGGGRAAFKYCIVPDEESTHNKEIVILNHHQVVGPTRHEDVARSVKSSIFETSSWRQGGNTRDKGRPFRRPRGRFSSRAAGRRCSFCKPSKPSSLTLTRLLRVWFIFRLGKHWGRFFALMENLSDHQPWWSFFQTLVNQAGFYTGTVHTKQDSDDKDNHILLDTCAPYSTSWTLPYMTNKHERTFTLSTKNQHHCCEAQVLAEECTTKVKTASR